MNTKINELMDVAMLRHRKTQPKREYLGASFIGDDCLRKIQLQCMGKEQPFNGRTLRTFDIGHHLEPMAAEWMKLAGFSLLTHDIFGEQFGFSVADGRIAGHVDGIIYALPEVANFTCQTPCIWEFKTMNKKSWNDVNKRGIMLSKPQYYAQIQVYMAYMNFDACLFTALNKDSSELYFEVVPFDSEAAQKYSDRAALVISATEHGEFLPKISNDASFFCCKMCGFHSECWGEQS